MTQNEITSRICGALNSIDEHCANRVEYLAAFKASPAMQAHRTWLDEWAKEMKIRQADLAEFRKDARELRLDEEPE